MDNNRGVPQATAEELPEEIELMKRQLLSSIAIDIDAAQNYSNESAGGSGCSIFRIPRGIAGGIAKVCQPRTISIGPYHHGKPELMEFQNRKHGYLHDMLGRTRHCGIGLEHLINVVVPKERMIRQCYSESTHKFSGPDLVKMMIYDGCFIIELFRREANVVAAYPEPLLDNPYEMTLVMRDLLLLENQIPYFVLKDLFETTRSPTETTILADLIVEVLASGFIRGHDNARESGSNVEGVHLLDLFRSSLIPSSPQNNTVDANSAFPVIRSASELHRVGIGFEQREARTFLDINFDSRRRIIGIPKRNLHLHDDDLRLILPNMIAFEQCCGQSGVHVTAYAMFMGCLIHTVDDVQLLRDCKVISNHGMSNNEFADFFSAIRKTASFDVGGSYLAPEFARINESLKYERALHCWAQLLNPFHDNPWSALSGLAVVVTLVGIIQTVYAVLGYYYPKK